MSIRTSAETTRSAAALANVRMLAAALVFMSIMVLSCHRRALPPAVPPAAPPPAVPAAPVPPPPAPSPNPARSSYEAAEKSFDAGNYPAALIAYEACLRANVVENLDRVHFRLGLAYALAGESVQNLRESRIHFQRVVTQFAWSPYRIQAELILSLLSEIEKLNGSLKEQQTRIKTLSDELQRLKSIDMQRHPSRPPD
jgi:hypothetical protein